MSLRCPRTDIGLYDFTIRRPRAPPRAVPEAHELFDQRVWDAIRPERTRDDARLEATLHRITPDDVELMGARLGNGRTSTAYLCRLKFAPAQTLVVKVPNPVVAGITEYVSDERPGTLPARWQVLNQHIFTEYEEELRTMERLLEPDEYVQRVQRSRADGQSLTRAEVRRFFLAREALRMHRGYAHIHHIVHVEYGRACGYPMFFSDPCDGTVESLTEKNTYPDSDAPAWRELVRQTLCGFDYIVSRQIISTDIHDGNIYYKQRGPEAYHYVIGDFGGFTYQLDAASPWTGNNNMRIRQALHCMCRYALHWPFRREPEKLKAPYRSAMTPMLDPVGFIDLCSGMRAKKLYDELIQVAAPEPMVNAPAAPVEVLDAAAPDEEGAARPVDTTTTSARRRQQEEDEQITAIFDEYLATKPRNLLLPWPAFCDDVQAFFFNRHRFRLSLEKLLYEMHIDDDNARTKRTEHGHVILRPTDLDAELASFVTSCRGVREFGITWNDLYARFLEYERAQGIEPNTYGMAQVKLAVDRLVERGERDGGRAHHYLVKYMDEDNVRYLFAMGSDDDLRSVNHRSTRDTVRIEGLVMEFIAWLREEQHSGAYYNLAYEGRRALQAEFNRFLRWRGLAADLYNASTLVDTLEKLRAEDHIASHEFTVDKSGPVTVYRFFESPW